MLTETSLDALSVTAVKSKEWLDTDGSIAIDEVSQRLPEEKPARHWLRDLYTSIIIPPVFLGVMVSTILLIPKALLRYHRNFVRRSMSFSCKLAKRALDVMGALCGLMVSSLIFLLLPILIKLDSSGNVIFKQVRIGRNRRKQGRDRRVISLEVPFERRKSVRRQDDLLGRPFMVYKFRSMRQDAEMKTGPIWASRNDPRVTNIGKILRPYHLDELPQFVNVLKGEMSLVGPRPERPEFIRKLKTEIPEYERRFVRKPGLTGLAQITCGYDTTTEDVNKKLRFDLQYINNFNLVTDLKILWGTAKKIVLGKEKLDEEI